jgi:hypothetical protein
MNDNSGPWRLSARVSDELPGSSVARYLPIMLVIRVEKCVRCGFSFLM